MKISDTRLQNFKNVLAEKGLRLTDIADLLGKAPAQVSAFGGKNPTKGIGNKIAREIENALHLESGYLDIPYRLRHDTALREQERKLPVLEPTNVGIWSTNLDSSFDIAIADEWIYAPGPVSPGSFVLKIDGLSMEPIFRPGDKVVIDLNLVALPGHFVVAKKNQEQAATLKELRKEGNDFYLHALNPDWPERIIKITEEWTIYGRARWKISDL